MAQPFDVAGVAVQLGDLPVRADLGDLGAGETGQDLLTPDGVAGLGLGVDPADLEEALPSGGSARG